MTKFNQRNAMKMAKVVRQMVGLFCPEIPFGLGIIAPNTLAVFVNRPRCRVEGLGLAKIKKLLAEQGIQSSEIANCMHFTYFNIKPAEVIVCEIDEKDVAGTMKLVNKIIGAYSGPGKTGRGTAPILNALKESIAYLRSRRGHVREH